MDNQNKAVLVTNGVRNSLIAVLVLLAIFLLGASINEFKTYSVIGRDVASSNTITVTGKGEVTKAPDVATFTFGVTEESLSVSDAQDKSSKTLNTVKDFLTKNGVDAKDIKTTAYNIYPRYEYQGGSYYNQGKRVLAAYVVSVTDEVKVRKLSDAGKLIGGLGELGATDVSSLTFTFDDEEAVKTEARNDAIAQAKANAEDIARGLGVSLGRIVSFNESGQVPPVYYGMGAGVAMKSDAAIVPDITPGESKVTSNVTITYELR